MTATKIAVERAKARAARLYESPGFRTVYVNGAKARAAGKPADACPYRRGRGSSWRRTYREVWLRGWHSAGT